MTGAQIAEITARSGRRWTSRVLAVAGVLGPGLIAANAGHDAGKILSNASANAQFTYRTLVVMLTVTVALVIVREMCSRLGVNTGEGLRVAHLHG
jgi:Mn2+/Fe2+ NRAMP family transporter